MNRTCIFCSSELGKKGEARAKEHVVPVWLQKYLKLSEEEIFQAVMGSGGEVPELERRQAMDSFQEGRVCKACNGGWMSRMETAFMPIFKDEVEDRMPINLRSAQDKMIVARWAAKTAFVLTWPTMLKKPVPTLHMGAMGQGEHGIPIGVCVFYARTGFPTSFSFVQMNRWIVIQHQADQLGFEQSAAAPQGSYKIGFSIGTIAFVVAFWSGENAQQALMAGFHVPLFPDQRVWPAHTAVLHDKSVHPGVQALATLVSGIGVIVRSV